MTMNATSQPAAPNLDFSFARKFGGIAVLVLVGILGTWASLATISGAVVTAGQAIVHGKPKLVQSLDGGTVSEIKVANGDLVEQGALLLHLDPTLVQTSYDIARARLGAALALRARLTAEQTGAGTITYAYPDLPFALPDTASHERGQNTIFSARAAVLEGRRDQLVEKLANFESQSTGIQGQTDAIHKQIALLDGDLVNMRKLAAKGLARKSQMSELQRNRAQLSGQLASLQSDTVQLADTRRESQLELLQTERSFRETVVTELRDVTTQVEELTLEAMTYSTQLARLDVRAPATGIVHELQATTVGGIIAPGETILEIVPLDTGMDFELRVDPRAIDQVYTGQTARLVMSGLDVQTTPQLMATVRTISAGVISDPRSGQGFYRVELSVSAQERALLGDVALLPGMPVEAYLETGDRSVLSYLLHPIASHLSRALRE